jgi:hypothetical protein
MATRLHSKYPELARLILALPPAKLRLVVATAAKLAVQNAGLESDLLREVLAAVDGREVLQPDVKKKLIELQQQLDDSYLDAQDSAEGQQALPAEALQSFYRARALAAVLAAVVEVDATEATEIVYEAIASSSNEDQVAETIQRRAD